MYVRSLKRSAYLKSSIHLCMMGMQVWSIQLHLQWKRWPMPCSSSVLLMAPKLKMVPHWNMMLLDVCFVCFNWTHDPCVSSFIKPMPSQDETRFWTFSDRAAMIVLQQLCSLQYHFRGLQQQQQQQLTNLKSNNFQQAVCLGQLYRWWHRLLGAATWHLPLFRQCAQRYEEARRLGKPKR